MAMANTPGLPHHYGVRGRQAPGWTLYYGAGVAQCLRPCAVRRRCPGAGNEIGIMAACKTYLLPLT